ncbi:MAG TPA: nucleotidyltransferase domain-containing protein [Humisphaera sp.]|nr:nucleotidyltransferase domain-containing protein [Humisphaera sp.]
MIDLIEQHREQLLALCRTYDVRRLDLFGSAVRADFNPEDSDLDFVVEFNNFTIHNAADRYFDLLFDLEALFGRKIDLIIESSIRNPYLRKSIEADRVNLYAA